MDRAEIAAWSKPSNERRDYLGLQSFSHLIFANFFDDENGEGYRLI